MTLAASSSFASACLSPADSFEVSTCNSSRRKPRDHAVQFGEIGNSSNSSVIRQKPEQARAQRTDS